MTGSTRGHLSGPCCGGSPAVTPSAMMSRGACGGMEQGEMESERGKRAWLQLHPTVARIRKAQNPWALSGTGGQRGRRDGGRVRRQRTGEWHGRLRPGAHGLEGFWPLTLGRFQWSWARHCTGAVVRPI
jgi:hypothetical protein